MTRPSAIVPASGGTAVETARAINLIERHPIIPRRTPASASDAGDEGSIAYDDDYLYVCIGADSWARFAKAAW